MAGKLLFILWMHLIRTGQCDPRKTIVPTIIEDHHERTYKCKFNETVDCLWQKNGITTKISPYKYVEGNGTNTQDCSIVADISQTRLNWELCIGLIKSPVIPKAISGGSTQINCSSDTKIKCSWKRNGKVVHLDNIKYKYIGQHNGNDTNDCSITIADVTAIDNGTWDCLGKITSEMNSDATIIATYDLQWIPTSTAATTTTLTNGVIITESNGTLVSIPTESAKTLSQEALVGIIVSSTLFNVIIGVVIHACKRLKRKKRRNRTKETAKTTEDEGQSLRELPQPPRHNTGQPPHTYVNMDAIVPIPPPLSSLPLRSTDTDGYLVPKKCTGHKASDNKNDDNETVKSHVYEKIIT